MSPEAQRIAIAEAYGWEAAKSRGIIVNGWKKGKNFATLYQLPNYLCDLNAMHEAEKDVIFKDVKLYLKFATELEMVVGGNIDALFATASQRAEAFLRTLGFWKE